MSCIYCGSNGSFTDEHVLPRAFAGGGENWVLEDQVCADCNSRFSVWERRWTAQPGLALARICHGPTSRVRDRAYQTHPSENLFLIVKDDPILYEVDVLPGLQPRFRVQLIGTPTKVVPVASSADDFVRFQNAYNAFVSTREVTIQKRKQKGPYQFRIAVLDIDSPCRVIRVKLRGRPATTWLDKFPRGAFGGEGSRKDPRMSVDVEGRLRIRASRLADVPAFLDQVFGTRDVSSTAKTHAGGSYRVVSREIAEVSSDSPTFRAVAKTAVNYAVSIFGPEWIASPNFRPILDFCLGKDVSKVQPFVGILDPGICPTGVTEIDTAPTSRHAMALLSNGERVLFLLRLYSGMVYRVHLGGAPSHDRFRHAIQIDYNGNGRVR